MAKPDKEHGREDKKVNTERNYCFRNHLVSPSHFFAGGI